jgi:predicted Zn finger-like uncharacterized protein
MIAACPKCQAKYRVDTERLGAGEARLRCAKCQAVFRVRAPQEAAPEPRIETPAPAPQQAPRAAAPEAAPRTLVPPPPAPEPEEVPVDRERLILVADPDLESGKATHAALVGLGLQPILVHDGVEAMMTIQRMLPRAVILDAALPKMFGFQICEVVKRNESLKPINVALIGSVHRQERYRRPPNELYGADVYLEKPELPEQLYTIVSRFGFDVTPGAPAPSAVPPAAPPAPAPDLSEQRLSPPQVAEPPPAEAPAAPTPVQSAAPPAPAAAPAAEDEGLAAERANAERLARIIVSDIVLYQPEIFDQGLPPAQLASALEGAIAEGRSFFAQRIDASVRDEKDYLMEELMRQARERSGQ